MLVLIRGLPGSGKSTLAQTLKDRGAIDAFHEADQYSITAKVSMSGIPCTYWMPTTGAEPGWNNHWIKGSE